MKKFLSLILAAIMMFSIGTVAFAHENADNTFDNFTPGPGLKAPDNWYDPYCYDENGHILPNCLIDSESQAALYCQIHGKIWEIGSVQTENDTIYQPYTALISVYVEGEGYLDCPVHYCPYCGESQNGKDASFYDHHRFIPRVVYGAYCSDCGGFSGYPSSPYEANHNYMCFHCTGTNNIEEDKFYRFVSKDELNSDAAHIYNESAYMYGDGQDGYIEDLVENELTIIVGWEPGSSDELTFWEKIVAFFQSIGEFFVKLFTWSW